jgi:biopolymer transport protein ExbD
MAATVQSAQGDVVADMNTTPLIDVMLVLLTLLIITLPMQTNAIKIDSPHPAVVPPPQESIDLVVDMDGTLIWNGQIVDRAGLDARLADAARKVPQPDIRIQADRLAKYDRVAMVLADSARAGETHIGFVDMDGR